MATMIPKVLEIERYQLADYARVDYAITKAEGEIAALEELWPGSNELRRESSVVHDRTVLAVREVRKNMAKRAIIAKNMQGSLVESLRQRSRIAKICRAAEMADARIVDLYLRCDPIFVYHRGEPTGHGPDRSRAFDTSLLGARSAVPREHAIVSARSAFAA